MITPGTEYKVSEYYKDKLSESFINTIELYVNRGLPPGDFLCSVLANKFIDAVCFADADNQRRLVDIARFVYNDLPLACWGSKETVERWMDMKYAIRGLEVGDTVYCKPFSSKGKVTRINEYSLHSTVECILEEEELSGCREFFEYNQIEWRDSYED